MCACFMTSGESLPLQTSISSLAGRETVVFSELLGLLFLTYQTLHMAEPYRAAFPGTPCGLKESV